MHSDGAWMALRTDAEAQADFTFLRLPELGTDATLKRPSSRALCSRALHQITMSDRGILASYRHMHASAAKP